MGSKIDHYHPLEYKQEKILRIYICLLKERREGRREKGRKKRREGGIKKGGKESEGENEGSFDRYVPLKRGRSRLLTHQITTFST